MKVIVKESFCKMETLNTRLPITLKIRKTGWYFFYENGQVRWEGKFKEGKEDGERVYYFEDGKVFCRDY